MVSFCLLFRKKRKQRPQELENREVPRWDAFYLVRTEVLSHGFPPFFDFTSNV